MSQMVEMVIDSVRVSLTNQQRVVVLREVDRDRYLPIWIGPAEADSITLGLQEIEVARPQTHDLLKNLLVTLNARLVRVEITDLRNDIFYGNLVLEVNNQKLDVDCRPSDAVALAVRAHVPLFVSRDVIDAAAIVPDRDLGLAPEEEQGDDLGEEPSAERLSVFEEIFKNMDLGPGEEPPPQEDQGDKPEDTDGPEAEDKGKPRPAKPS